VNNTVLLYNVGLRNETKKGKFFASHKVHRTTMISVSLTLR